MLETVYRITKVGSKWGVVSGYMDKNTLSFNEDRLIFEDKSFTECYNFLKAKQEKLIVLRG